MKFSKQAVIDRIEARLVTMRAEEAKEYAKAVEQTTSLRRRQSQARAKIEDALVESVGVRVDQLPKTEEEWERFAQPWFGKRQSTSSWGLDEVFRDASTPVQEPRLNTTASDELQSTLDIFKTGSSDQVTVTELERFGLVKFIKHGGK